MLDTNIDNFLRGGKLKVREYTEEELADLYQVENIVKYARNCLGNKDYNLFLNNCEHFANICTPGKFRSEQIENFINLTNCVNLSFKIIEIYYKKTTSKKGRLLNEEEKTLN